MRFLHVVDAGERRRLLTFFLGVMKSVENARYERFLRLPGICLLDKLKAVRAKPITTIARARHLPETFSTRDGPIGSLLLLLLF